MKAVRSREENLDELKRRRKSIFTDAEAAERKLSKMNPENKNLQQQTDHLNRLREEIRTMDADIMAEEASLGDFKRGSVRSWMGRKYGALQECCEKGTVCGTVMITLMGCADCATADCRRTWKTCHLRECSIYKS